MATRFSKFDVAESSNQAALGLGNLALIALVSIILWAGIIVAAIEIF